GLRPIGEPQVTEMAEQSLHDATRVGRSVTVAFETDLRRYGVVEIEVDGEAGDERADLREEVLELRRFTRPAQHLEQAVRASVVGLDDDAHRRVVAAQHDAHLDDERVAAYGGETAPQSRRHRRTTPYVRQRTRCDRFDLLGHAQRLEEDAGNRQRRIELGTIE